MVFLGGRVAVVWSAMRVSGNLSRAGPKEVLDRVKYVRDIGDMDTRGLERRVGAVRRFNRFYTRKIGALRTIQQLWGERDTPTPPGSYVLRAPQPGDLGWVVHRHGALYAREYGYDQEFEGIVAEIGARFVQRFDAKRERCWIAERDGE